MQEILLNILKKLNPMCRLLMMTTRQKMAFKYYQYFK